MASRTPSPRDRLLDTTEAAALAHVHPSTIRKALRTTDPNCFPPPLACAGRKGPRGQFLIRESDLEVWIGWLSQWSPTRQPGIR